MLSDEKEENLWQSFYRLITWASSIRVLHWSILNMVRPESGTVTMLRKDFYANEKECKQDIGVVFGGIDFYPLKKLSAITAVTRRFCKDWDQERV